jgi:phospholipid transport system transporter-binding protein
MTDVTQCQRRDDGVFAMSGPLVFDTVPRVYERFSDEVRRAGSLTLDLAGVKRADSAGLALLLEWLQSARETGNQIRFVNVPKQIRSLARVSGLEKALGLDS